ncbi:MAG: Peptidase serine carboxypeptidase [Chthoniobacteraceae bacterium]|nr:Peptidase serine carboxypeptidase [Chthoniobacteraceae bacterium]
MALLRFLPICIALLISLPLQAEEEPPVPPHEQGAEAKKPAGSEPKKEDSKEEGKSEKAKEKPGKVSLGGAGVSYIAQTGTIPVFKEDGSIRANVFYVYYAVTDEQGKRLGVKDAGARPITFCFNGGPGASSVWLHLGGLGPRRLDLPTEGLTPASVAKVVDNPNSILDATDLVFVDPVSTGLSRAAKGEKPEQFFGVDEDIQSIGEFVRLFTTREQRWSSPKYLCGESYGVTRVSGLSAYLQDKHGFYAEGLILMSGLVNFQTLSADNGNDLPYIVFLPGMTATAHYHKKLAPDLQADFEKTMAESRAFAESDYALALLKGADLEKEKRHSIAEKIARLTALSVEQVEDQDLRIDPSFFRKALLRDQSKVVGRFDGRVTGEESDRSETRADFDPSYSNIAGGFSSAVNAYVRGELGYESDHPYHILTGLPWRWTSYENRYVSTEGKLARAIKTNPRLRVLVLTGLRDLAVPEGSMRYSIAHLPIPQSLRGNIEFSRYESGHMMYLFRPDAEKLRRDLLEFLKKR